MISIKKFWHEKPLYSVLILALFFRLISAIFSGGYINHDDHFLVIEASQSWVDGDDYNNWLPWNQENPKPEGHSFFYVGLHYLFFSFLKLIGIVDVKFKMFLVRLIHALFSLLVVYYSYKITEKIYNAKTAKQVGLVIALAWFIPFFSVRNLVELFCIPFLLIGVWKIITIESVRNKLLHYFLAGLIIGIAFSIRFQTIIFIGGVGLVILFQQKWSETIVFGIGVLLAIFAIQGVVDMVIWHRPFAELTEYVIYNWFNKDAYGTNNWFMYIALLSGIFIPPVSLFLLFGFFRTWKKYTLIFLPTLLFILFHNFFPNKQERFIFSILPFFVILGFIGWNEFVEKSKYWERHATLLKYSFTFFWIVNFALLILFTPAYSKRARCESMYYLSKYKDQIKNILIEDTNRQSVSMLPAYYLGKWNVYQYTLPQNNDTINSQNDSILYSKFRPASKYVREINSVKFYKYADASCKPQFILFYDKKNIEERVKRMQVYFPDMKLETVIETSFVDMVIFKMNAVNKNMPVYIYRVNSVMQ